MKISSKYNWLNAIPFPPKMLAAAAAIGKLDTTEWAGTKTNPEILALAVFAGVGDIYKSDEVAWCAIAHCAIALRAGKEVPFTGFARLRAKSFLQFGNHVDIPMLADTLVFQRPGGFHVGLYIGEDDNYFHVAGGNQGNQYSIVRMLKERLLEARRPIYKTGQPASVKQIFLEASGAVSSNES